MNQQYALPDLVTIKKYIKKTYDPGYSVDLFNDTAIITDLIKQNYADDPLVDDLYGVLMAKLAKTLYYHSLSDATVFNQINALIQTQINILIKTFNDTINTNQFNANFHYDVIERLTQLGRQVLREQKEYPNQLLMYHDDKLWKLFGEKQPLIKLSQIPKAIGLMHYNDVLNNIQKAIDQLKDMQSRYQPFLYAVEQHPNGPFNVDQFSNYLADWQKLDGDLELVTGNEKIKATMAKLRTINYTNESKHYDGLVDLVNQIKEQQAEVGYQLLYNNESIDNDLLEHGSITPWSNDEVKQFLDRFN